MIGIGSHSTNTKEDKRLQREMCIRDRGYVDAVGAHEESVVQYMKDYDTSFRILEEPLMVVGIGAVSYTHLDVYKRQALTGYGEQIKETARTTEEFHQVSGREKEELDQKLQLSLIHI